MWLLSMGLLQTTSRLYREERSTVITETRPELWIGAALWTAVGRMEKFSASNI